MPRTLPSSFFNRDALPVARDLIGMFLIRRSGEDVIAAMITETEAYTGPDDLACHAAKGRTARTDVMFGSPGYFYVYFVYGMHWMLNVVTREEGYPAAVLIRAVDGISGPARLTKHFQIDGALNAKPSARSTGLWIEDRGIIIRPRDIMKMPRIGVDYAGEWAEKPYRFLLST